MHHDLKIPNRSMLFIGPQRCGKTYSLTATVAQSSRDHKTLVICRTTDIKYLKGDFQEFGNLDNVVFIPLGCRDISAALRKHNISISEIMNVALLTSTVFVDVGMVRTWEKPSAALINFFQKLCEPTAMLPRVYIEAHIAGHEKDVALG